MPKNLLAPPSLHRRLAGVQQGNGGPPAQNKLGKSIATVARRRAPAPAGRVLAAAAAIRQFGGMPDRDRLRAVPAVERVLQALGELPVPRVVLTALVRRELARLRELPAVPPFADVVAAIRAVATEFHRTRIQPVINGTGVLIHTNLGRAPLGPEVVATLTAVAGHYTNLEFDLTTGARGHRAAYLEHNLALLCGAEAATVVNNCAAALVLVLRQFTAGERTEVIISRGELVEIGGGFRIPEILETSGARLREVGTTNRTTLDDFRQAIGPQTALILKVHRSNFFMGGFVASPEVPELTALAREHGLPFVHDLGSGAVARTEALAPVEHEPTPAELLGCGVELLCCSGDKLFGGPQAGIIAGRADYLAALKRNPFFRALRCDRLVLAALQETVDAYLRARDRGEAAPAGVPVLALLGAPLDHLRTRAETLVAELAHWQLPLEVATGAGVSRLGGGTMPTAAVPSVTIDLRPTALRLDAFARRLRCGSPPVVGYVAGDVLKLDLRTVFPAQDNLLVMCIRQAADPQP
jgi:L-seryl-tRNA(Ser) seleniumtransferase